MKIQPFGCDITIGTIEEQDEFKRLLIQATPNLCWLFDSNYYGYDKNGLWDYWYSKQSAINNFTRIIPLSEGIKILKQFVGEEAKQIDSKYVMLPRKLTFENGAKGLLIGEFKESVYFTVDGVENKIDVDVSWSTIKAIYNMIVENLQIKNP